MARRLDSPDECGRVCRVAVAGQHGRTNRLVFDLRLHRAQAHVHDVPWWRPGPALRAGLVRGDVAGAVPAGDRRDTELLRRRVRHCLGLPQGPVRRRAVGAIHGRLFAAWSAAGIAVPLIINAIAAYQTAAGRTGADLYTLSLYIMVGVLAVGFIANLLVRHVDPRFHMESGPEVEHEKESTVSGRTAGSEGEPHERKSAAAESKPPRASF